MSFWPVLCIVIVGLEGIFGVCVNSLVLILLLRGKLRTKSVYRVAMVVSTIHLIGMSAMSGVTTLCHVFHDQNYSIIFFGLLPLLPQKVGDGFLIVFMFFVFAMWELTPAPCILQYLALCQPNVTDRMKLLIAYSTVDCLVIGTLQITELFFHYGHSLDVVIIEHFLSCIPQQYYTVFLAIPEYRQDFALITRQVFDLSPDEGVVAYGAKLFMTEKSDTTVIPFAVIGILPTYLIAYLIFIFCCVRIYRVLNAYDVQLKSQRTLQMQKQFFKTLLLQGLLPLIVLAVPIGIFFVGLVGGFNMDRLTLLLTFSLWTVPTVQGVVSLSFVFKMKSSSVEGTSSRMRLEQRSASELH
uniref:G protein-coupled receptor n=1 Tax=Pristionchus pacificus TaxID=54126 RepID=A0A8R1UST7_PRIPA